MSSKKLVWALSAEGRQAFIYLLEKGVDEDFAFEYLAQALPESKFWDQSVLDLKDDDEGQAG